MLDLPISTAGGEQPSVLPLPNSDYWSSLIRYPSSSDNGEAAHVSARIPLEWMESITVLRDWVRQVLPTREIWRTNSDFIRWAIALGLEEGYKLKTAADTGQLPENSSTGLLSAQLFIEQIGGELQARAQTMSKADARARQVARAIRNLMNRKEPTEAADMISRWVEGAQRVREQSGSAFWETYFINSLFRCDTILEDAKLLIEGQYIIDENVIANVEHIVNLVESGEFDIISTDYDPEEKIVGFPPDKLISYGDAYGDNSTG